MSTAQDPGWVTERPLFVQAGQEQLFAILTEPRSPSGTAVIHLRGGNQGPSSGRNQTSTRLCRRLAEEGFHTLRFDYRGVGDSTGAIDRFRHDETFEDDVEACVKWLRNAGIERFVLVGECFGARTALACASLPGLAALVLLAAPVRDAMKVPGSGTKPLVRHRSLPGYAAQLVRPGVLRRMADPRTRRRYLRAARAALSAARPTPGPDAGPGWVSSTFLRQLEAALRRQVSVLFVNGTKDPSFEDFQRAKDGRFGAVVSEAGPLVRMEVLQGRLAAWAQADVQQSTIDLVTDWLANLHAGSSSTSPDDRASATASHVAPDERSDGEMSRPGRASGTSASGPPLDGQGRRAKILYIVGLPRSGSTILGSILGEIPGFFHAGEVGYLWERHLLRQKRKCGCGLLVQECEVWADVLEGVSVSDADVRQAVDAQKNLLRLGGWPALIARDPLSIPGVADHVDRLEALYSQVANVCGCSVIVDGSKRPGDAVAAALLRRRGWEVFLLHLTRNPIEMAVSRQRKKLAREVSGRLKVRRLYLIRDSIWWCLCNMSASVVRARYGRGSEARLAYEDFARRPETSVTSILRLIGEGVPVPVTNGQVRLNGSHALGGNRNRFVTGDVRIELKERRQQLGSFDRLVASAVAAPASWAYGYRLPW